MLRAIDVANFFVDLANSDPDDVITNLKVNKLLYFAQAWSLVIRHEPLFEEDIQAWKLGPVVCSVYQAFKPCGRERISSVSGDYSVEMFSDDELELLIDVAREYGKYTSPALVNFTHEPGGPWEKVYVPEANNVITKNDLESYFSRKHLLKSFQTANLSNVECVGFRDPADGLLVLPKELDDAE